MPDADHRPTCRGCGQPIAWGESVVPVRTCHLHTPTGEAVFRRYTYHERCAPPAPGKETPDGHEA